MSQARALCIPPVVLALPTVSWPARLVLSEVLALHKAQGCVWANDSYFVERCLLSLRTVQAAVKELVDAGLLARLTKQSAQHKRVLTPTLPPDNGAEPPAKSAGATPDLPQDSREPTADFAGDLPQISREPTAESAVIIYKVIKEENREGEHAASAATTPSSFSVEGSQKPKPTASRKKAAAHADEVAALDLPHASPEFAQLWAEFRAMPKQVKKPVTSLRRLLATLAKYEDGFAQLMLDKAIQGAWSGVEFDGTAKTYAEWRAAQAARAHRQPVRTNSPDGDGPEPNQEFLDEVAARKQAEEDAHFARWHVPSVVVDPNKEFGYNQTAAEGLAQARATPEYQQYLAELEAAKKQAATDAEPKPPTPSTENPAGSAQEQA